MALNEHYGMDADLLSMMVGGEPVDIHIKYKEPVLIHVDSQLQSDEPYDEVRARLQLSQRLQGDAAASAATRVSRLEALVDPLLAAVAVCLSTADVLRSLFNVSRRMRCWLATSRVPRPLRLDSAAAANCAAAVLAPAAWANLRALHVGDRALTGPLRRCLGQLGASLRHLRFPTVDVERLSSADLAAVPALAWAALKTCRVVVRRQTGWVLPFTTIHTFPEQKYAPPAPLPRLAVERLELCSLSSTNNPPCFEQFLRAASGGTLRVLSLTANSCTDELGAALELVAPHLEALHIHERWRRYTVFKLPPLPRVHTLVLSCEAGTFVGHSVAVEHSVAATPHLALRTLQLRGRARLRVADGDGWSLDALHTLVFEWQQSYAGLLERLAPACGTLRALSLVARIVKTERVARPASFDRLAAEHEEYRIGPLLSTVGASLEELSISAKHRPCVEGVLDMRLDEVEVAVDLRLDLAKYASLHTLRLSSTLMPADAIGCNQALPASVRTVDVLEATAPYTPDLPPIFGEGVVGNC